MATPEPAPCPSCGQPVGKKDLYRAHACEVCNELVCYDCIRRKQILPPSWEAPAGTFRYRCKRHTGAPLGLGWQKVERPHSGGRDA